MPITKQQIAATLNVVMAVAEAVRELKQVPSGHLYATLCDKLTLEDYNAVVATLKGAGLVTERHHTLTWTGPTFTERNMQHSAP